MTDAELLIKLYNAGFEGPNVTYRLASPGKVVADVTAKVGNRTFVLCEIDGDRSPMYLQLVEELAESPSTAAIAAANAAFRAEQAKPKAPPPEEAPNDPHPDAPKAEPPAA